MYSTKLSRPGSVTLAKEKMKKFEGNLSVRTSPRCLSPSEPRVEWAARKKTASARAVAVEVIHTSREKGRVMLPYDVTGRGWRET